MPSKVYYTKTDNKDSIKAISRKLASLIRRSKILDFIKSDDYTGIKTHFGEAGNTGHIHHEWVKTAVRSVLSRTKNVFVTDSNVLYKNSRRANSVDHLKLAHEHGFDLENIGAPVLIADGMLGKNYVEVDVNKKHFSKVKIASDIANCDSLLVLSHITGHVQTGFAGAIKNLGMGCASRRGKYEQHSGIVPEVRMRFCTGCGLCRQNCPASCIVIESGKARILKGRCIGCGECVVVCRTKAIETKWSETLENLQEKMVEYAYGAVSVLNRRVGYVNFIIKVTRNCDCLARDESRIRRDLGMLASQDPVAIDKAAADLLNEEGPSDVFKKYYPQIDWTVQLRYAAKIGLGTLNYALERL